MRRLLILLVTVLTLLGRQGASEALENLAHAAVEGHAAHAQVDSDHDAHDPMHLEHGCGGGAHVCPCHAPVNAAPVDRRTELARASAVTVLEPDLPDRDAPRGVRRGVFRPPTS